MVPAPGDAATFPPLSEDPDDPLSFFPSESGSDATHVARPKEVDRPSDGTAHERFIAATDVETVQAPEKRLGPLAALQDLSRHVDEQFAALTALAAEVTLKVATLKDGDRLLEHTEERLQRLEAVAAETTAQLERREQLRDELARELVRLETDVQILTESGRRQVETSKTETAVWDNLRAQLRETEQAVKESVAHTNGQKEMIEHAVAEAGRVAGLVDAMETRMATLKDGNHLLDQTEARLQRLEALAADMAAQLERREQLRVELGRELVRLESEVQILTESGRRQVEASKTEAAVWENLRAQLRDTEQVIKQSVAQTDERLEALNALAEEVTVTGYTLNGQKEMIERAVAEAGRVAGMVDALQTRMATLKDGDRLLDQTEAGLERLEALAVETAAQLEQREWLRDELARELVSLQTEVEIVTESARRQVGGLSIPVLRPDSPTPGDSIDQGVERPLPRLEWERPGSPHLRSTAAMTRIRIPNTGRSIKYGGAGVGLALLVVVGVIAARSPVKTVPIERPPLPAHIMPSLTISVPVVSGANLVLDEPTTPTIATRPATLTARPPVLATKPPAIAARAPAVDTRLDRAAATVPSAEYFGTLAIESSPSGAAVFVDRQQVGQTPLELPRVRAGSHAVRLERDGYQRWTAAVNVPASQVTRVNVKLDAEVVR